MIPLYNTKISFKRASNVSDVIDPYGEGYDTDTDQPDVWSMIATNVRAVISEGGGSNTTGDSEIMNFKMVSDIPEAIPTYKDRVVDEKTNQEYEVIWLRVNPGVNGKLSHISAGLVTLQGANTFKE